MTPTITAPPTRRRCRFRPAFGSPARGFRARSLRCAADRADRAPLSARSAPITEEESIGSHRAGRGRRVAGGAVRGQAGHRRPGPHGRADVRRAAGPRPLPARGRAGRRQDAGGAHVGHRRRRHVHPAPVHPRPGARRHRRHPDLPALARDVRHRARPGLRQLRARRRDQPRPGQGAVGPAGGDGRAAGDPRRRRPTRCPSRSS